MDSQQPTRASLASVDARVARLEQAQAETDAKIGLIQLEQQHTRELMNSKFATLEATMNANTSKLDQFIARIENMILDATKQSGDLTASPVGRQVDQRLTRLEAKTEIAESFMDRLNGMGTAMRWVIGTSVIGFLTGLLALLGAFGVIH